MKKNPKKKKRKKRGKNKRTLFSKFVNPNK